MDIRGLAERLKSVSDTPVLDARLLAAHDPDRVEALLQRRLRHEPVSKIIGRRGFWKSEFITTPDVLDPRPDSETLIEAVLRFFPDREKSYRILDIGTGSGCLLFSLLDEYPRAVGVGLDISDKALAVAARNKGPRSADLIQRDFYRPDWTQGLGQFDILISNPPYIPTGDIRTLAPDVRDYDPLTALDGGPDGLRAYRALAGSLKGILAENGLIFLEIGQGQAPAVTALFQTGDWQHRATVPDLGHIDRVLVFGK